jgi:hypothetical protein
MFSKIKLIEFKGKSNTHTLISITSLQPRVMRRVFQHNL